MSDHTPPTWPRGHYPTTAELLEYVRAADDDHALRILDAYRRDAEVAHRCIVSDHDHGMRQLVAAQLDAARWRTLVDELRHRDLTHPLDPTARRVSELMGEDHREDPTP